MPQRISLEAFGVAPLDDWSRYPGVRPRFSYLFCGDHLRRPDQRGFDIALAELDAPSMLERHAVLAYGSNASPAQLARKYRDAACSSTIPMTRGRVQHLAVGFSDHETSYGAVPATPIVSAGVSTEVFVAWLDDDQLADLDRTEARNYERRRFDLRSHPLQPLDGPMPVELDLYVSLWGIFTHDGVVPGVAGIGTTYRAGPLLTQADVRALRAPSERD